MTIPAIWKCGRRIGDSIALTGFGCNIMRASLLIGKAVGLDEASSEPNVMGSRPAPGMLIVCAGAVHMVDRNLLIFYSVCIVVRAGKHSQEVPTLRDYPRC